MKIGRNDPCPCGSGKKYKYCCLNKRGIYIKDGVDEKTAIRNIVKAKGYDENIAAEIKDIKVEIVEKAVKEKDAAVERARKFMVENKDLKDYLKAKGLMDETGRLTTRE